MSSTATPAAPLMAPPSWLVTVQRYGAANERVCVQIDLIDSHGRNTESASPETLMARGYALPSFAALPQGQWRIGELTGELASR